MKIIYLASEVAPFIKTGGLADVLYALPKKMSELGHEVSVILPKYDKIKLEYLEKIEYVDTVELYGEIYNLVKYPDKNINYYFIENRSLYERGHIYGDMDEDVQYATFCEVVLMFMKKRNMQPDIVHCNDWQTGPFPYFLKSRYYNDFNPRIIFTIHNLMYQGKFNDYSFKKLNYDINRYNLNFMEIGIEFSDRVNTVSPTYSEEIRNSYFSEGLEYIINQKNVCGILNGIDYDMFNPQLEKNENIFSYKEVKKEKLLKRFFGYSDPKTMVISVVSRLVEGKGLDLVKARLEEIIKYDAVKVIVLGSGDYEYESYFNYLTSKYPDKFRVYLGYSEEIAEEIYSGSDLFLMPSRYEPCGLSQMIAMRYGTVPLVRETGGLRDTVKPFNIISKEGNGFSFTNFNADDMLYTIRYAERIYYDEKENWKLLVKKNIEIDNSWEKSAREYENLYKGGF